MWVIYLLWKSYSKYSYKKKRLEIHWSTLNAHCARQKATLYFVSAIAATMESRGGSMNFRKGGRSLPLLFPSLHSPFFLSPTCSLNSMKFAKLILRQVIKIVPTKCYILKLKCTKLDFCWGSALDPAGRAERGVARGRVASWLLENGRPWMGLLTFERWRLHGGYLHCFNLVTSYVLSLQDVFEERDKNWCVAVTCLLVWRWRRRNTLPFSLIRSTVTASVRRPRGRGAASAPSKSAIGVLGNAHSNVSLLSLNVQKARTTFIELLI